MSSDAAAAVLSMKQLKVLAIYGIRFNLGEALTAVAAARLGLTHVRISDCYDSYGEFGCGGSPEDVIELVRRCPSIKMLSVDYSNVDTVKLLRVAPSIEVLLVDCNLPDEAWEFDSETEGPTKAIYGILQDLSNELDSAPHLRVLCLNEDHGNGDDDRGPIEDGIEELEQKRRSKHQHKFCCSVCVARHMMGENPENPTRMFFSIFGFSLRLRACWGL